MNYVIRGIVAAAALHAATSATEVEAVPIVVPNAQAAAEGNDANFGPFFDSSVRYQQVYSASQFAASGPLMISQIAFRPDGAVTDATFHLVFNSVQIDLSTTSSTPGSLSPVFASNVGADNATVFNSFVNLSTPITGPSGGPKDFIVTFDITPFVYDPSAGNLLMDVRALSLAGISAELDSESGNPFTAHVDASSIVASTGDVFASGLVTRFEASEVRTVPEPSTLTLSVIGVLAGIGALKRRRTRRLDV
jgi:hypothetical protein